MSKLNYVAASLLLASLPFAYAQTASQPVSQGEASVDKNLSKNPNNPGLQNADQVLEQNEAKVAAKRAAAAQKRQAARRREEMRENSQAEKHERENMGRPETMERPERPERPGR